MRNLPIKRSSNKSFKNRRTGVPEVTRIKEHLLQIQRGARESLFSSATQKGLLINSILILDGRLKLQCDASCRYSDEVECYG